MAYTCLRMEGLWSKKLPQVSWKMLPQDKQEALESDLAGHTPIHRLCPALLQPDRPPGGLAASTPHAEDPWQLGHFATLAEPAVTNRTVFTAASIPHAGV